jgi:cytochrome c oxidase cbb3-type subunit II
MKNAPVFLLGLFSAIVISFGGIVLGSHAQLGSLTPYFDADGGGAYPDRASGIASRGQLVYADLGCAACHTQQVRRPDFGSDQARGWGERQSVARDYIHQIRPQLGASRFGPDLMTLAGRKPSAPDADDLLNFLYSGSPTHPSYKFLFEVRAITGEASRRALKLTGRAAPAMGFEIVPTERAQALVTYLLTLNSGYDYPEARPVAPEPKKAGHAAAPAAKHEEKPVPTAAPDEKKKEAPKK